MRKARSCSELLEAVAPLAARIIAESPDALPHLFFITQDGREGILKLSLEASRELDKDWQASRFRWFCAFNGVRACAFLATGKIRETAVFRAYSDRHSEAGNMPDVSVFSPAATLTWLRTRRAPLLRRPARAYPCVSA